MSIASALAALLFAFVSVLVPLRPPAAQTSDEKLDAILEDIDKTTDQYSKFRLLLSDPDPAKRMAAFAAMTDSRIPTLKEMALDHAFSSGDAAMKAAALQVLLINTKALTFVVEIPNGASERTKERMASTGGGFSIEIESWDANTTSFSGADDSYASNERGQGQVTGLSFHYTSRKCRLFAVLEETGRSMRGELTCDEFAEPVAISLAVR